MGCGLKTLKKILRKKHLRQVSWVVIGTICKFRLKRKNLECEVRNEVIDQRLEVKEVNLLRCRTDITQLEVLKTKTQSYVRGKEWSWSWNVSRSNTWWAPFQFYCELEIRLQSFLHTSGRRHKNQFADELRWDIFSSSSDAKKEVCRSWDGRRREIDGRIWRTWSY